MFLYFDRKPVMFSSVPNWVIIILVILEAVKLQIPLPMPWNPGYAQMMPVPMPMPMQMPMPMPVQIAVPGTIPQQCRDKNGGNKCPPCPPCSCLPCTPSFFAFCSPCHKKCRCKNPEDAPEPLPVLAPQPIPGPAFPMPVPPMPMMLPIPAMPMAPPRWRRKRPRRPLSEECDSSESSYERPRRRKRPKKYDIYRRRFDNSFENNGAIVKPVLSYIDNYGDIKVSKSLNQDEARALLDGVDIMSARRADITGPNENARLMKFNMGDNVLSNGQKEVIFRPPKNKKISNLSLTFQLS